MTALPKTSIFIPDLTASESMDIVRELRALGLVQGRDFEFRYQPREENGFTYEPTTERGCEFYFYESKWRTYMALKYATP